MNLWSGWWGQVVGVGIQWEDEKLEEELANTTRTWGIFFKSDLFIPRDFLLLKNLRILFCLLWGRLFCFKPLATEEQKIKELHHRQKPNTGLSTPVDNIINWDRTLVEILCLDQIKWKSGDRQQVDYFGFSQDVKKILAESFLPFSNSSWHPVIYPT